MRILKALASEARNCGCLLGIYETYSGDVVRLVDVVGGNCDTHRLGQRVDPGDQASSQRSSEFSLTRPSA